MTEQTNKAYRGQGRVAFLALIHSFRKLLDAGHPLKSIYDEHKDQLGIGYPQFTKYINRYIRKARDNQYSRKEARDGFKSASPQPKTKQSGFQHNPNSGNDRDDLI